MNLMKFSKVNCTVMHLGLGNSKYQHKPRDQKQPWGEGLGNMDGQKLNMSWQCAHGAQKANPYPGLHQKAGNFPPLLCSYAQSFGWHIRKKIFTVWIVSP